MTTRGGFESYIDTIKFCDEGRSRSRNQLPWKPVGRRPSPARHWREDIQVLKDKEHLAR
jgi:hypothetical protein